MAELPRVPFPDSTSRPIRYNLSQADIAGPYTAIAQASDKAAGALEAVSIPFAEQAANDVVRRDDNGNLVVDKLPPLFGGAATAARMTIAAKLQPQIETDLLKHKLDNPNDPVGFQKAAADYKPALLKGLDPQLAIGVGKMVDSTSQQYLRSLMVEKDHHDTAEFKQNMEAELTRNTDQTQVLARQEGGASTEEFAKLVADRDKIIEKMRADPRIKMGDDRAKLMRDEAAGNDIGQAKIGDVVRRWQTTKNKAQAQRELIDYFWGKETEKLPLSPRQRDHFVTEGLKSLETISAEDRKAITASKNNINGAITNWEDNPQLQTEAAYNDLKRAAQAVGDDEGQHMLETFLDMKPLFEILAGQNSDGRADKLDVFQHLTEGTRPFASQDREFVGPPGPPVRVDLSDAAAAHMWNQAVTKGRARAAQAAQSIANDLKYSAEHGHPISADLVDHFGKAAILGRRGDLIEEMRPLLATAVRRGEIPSDLSNAVVSNFRQAANQTVDPLEQRMLDKAAEQVEKAEEEKRKSPLQYASNRLGARPLGPLAPDKPDAFAGELAARGDTASKFHASEPKSGGASYITEQEAIALYPQLTHGLKGEDAAKTLGSLGVIPEQDRVATLAQPKVRDAVRDMSWSLDPARVESSMRQQAWLWNTDHRKYIEAYGPDAEHHLKSWQGLGAFTPEQRAQLLNKPVEGRDLAARKTIEEQATKDLSSWKAEDVAHQIGTSWGIPLTGPISRAIGTTPEVPMDGRTAEVFRNEFVSVTSTLVGSGLPLAEAKQRAGEMMAKEWRPSVLNNGALMKLPPEITYPKAPGEPDGRWINEQARQLVTSIRGPEQTLVAGEQVKTNWKIAGVIADAQTEEEYYRNQPPSYRFMIIDENGRHELLDDGHGNKRFRFNPYDLPEGKGPYNVQPGPVTAAYNQRRLELQNAQDDLMKHQAFRERMFGYNPRTGAMLRQPGDAGTFMEFLDKSRAGFPNFVRGLMGKPPLGQSSE